MGSCVWMPFRAWHSHNSMVYAQSCAGSRLGTRDLSNDERCVFAPQYPESPATKRHGLILKKRTSLASRQRKLRARKATGLQALSSHAPRLETVWRALRMAQVHFCTMMSRKPINAGSHQNFGQQPTVDSSAHQPADCTPRCA